MNLATPHVAAHAHHITPPVVEPPADVSIRARRGRVLLVTSNFPRWAGDSTTPFILHLAQDLQSLGWQARVLAPHAPGAAALEELEGVQVERFRYLWPESGQTVCYNGGALINLRKSRLNALKLPALVGAEFAAIARSLRSRQFDVVHSHWILPQGLTAGLAARLVRVPHIATVHGGDVFALQGSFLRRFKRLAFKLADAVTVNSSATRQAVARIGHCEAPVLTIPMGVNPPSTSAKAIEIARGHYRRGNGPLMIFVGRLVEEKGVMDFLEAVSDLRGTIPTVTGLVVGEGQDRPLFERRRRQLGLEDAVRFTGWLNSTEIAPLLAASDVLVAPSKRSRDGWVEAQGLTIAEAMLAGVPVVATASGGIVDLVHDRETGLTVPEAAPAAIAEAVRQIHGDMPLRDRMIGKARQLAERDYTRRGTAKRFSDLFEQVIACRPDHESAG